MPSDDKRSNTAELGGIATMVVIFNEMPKAAAHAEWYQKNRERVSERRKKRYADDPEYRQRKLAASQQYRKTGSSAQPIPSGCWSLEETAEEVGVAASTLRDWRKKNLFPEPLCQKGRLWFRPHQADLLKEIRDFFRKYGKRTGKYKQQMLQQVMASVAKKWE